MEFSKSFAWSFTGLWQLDGILDWRTQLFMGSLRLHSVRDNIFLVITLFFIDSWVFAPCPKHFLATLRKTPRRFFYLLFTWVSLYGTICLFSKYFKISQKVLKGRKLNLKIIEFLRWGIDGVTIIIQLNLYHENCLLFDLLFAQAICLIYDHLFALGKFFSNCLTFWQFWGRLFKFSIVYERKIVLSFWRHFLLRLEIQSFSMLY